MCSRWRVVRRRSLGNPEGRAEEPDECLPLGRERQAASRHLKRWIFLAKVAESGIKIPRLVAADVQRTNVMLCMYVSLARMAWSPEQGPAGQGAPSSPSLYEVCAWDGATIAPFSLSGVIRLHALFSYRQRGGSADKYVHI